MRYNNDPGCQFTGYIVAESVRAYFFQDWFWSEPMWVPKSQTKVMHGDYEVGVELSNWFCEKNGVTEVLTP